MGNEIDRDVLLQDLDSAGFDLREISAKINSKDPSKEWKLISKHLIKVEETTLEARHLILKLWKELGIDHYLETNGISISDIIKKNELLEKENDRLTKLLKNEV